MRVPIIVRVALLSCLATLPGCFRFTTDPQTQDRAGSAHVAVLSIAPWEEYVAALQPMFPMDEARALKEALPNTLGIDRRTSDAVSVGLKVALPTVATTATSQTASAASTTAMTTGGATIDTATLRNTMESSATRVQQPGLVSGVSDLVIPRAGEPPRPTANVLDSALSIDPFVRYNVATALFQEVRLLQRHVRDAIISPTQRGYVVRLQVTLMPARRNLALDAYSTLSVFAAKERDSSRPRGGVKLLGVPTADTALGRVRVVPLLVADNLEGAAESSSEAQLRELSLGLLGMLANAGVSGNAARSLSRLEAMLGRRLNSLLTVGQLNDNSVRVRFGAMNQPGSSPVLVARNQTVTLLIITDKVPPDGLRFVSKTDFVDAKTGLTLLSQKRDSLYRSVINTLATYGISVAEPDKVAAELISAVQVADAELFQTSLEAGRPSAAVLRYRESVWMDVATLVATLPYSVTTAPLPKPTDLAAGRAAILKHAPALALDDGKRVLVTLINSAHTRRRESNARLRVDTSGAQLVASSILIDETGRVTVSFPSISGSNLCTVTPKSGEIKCDVTSLTVCAPQQRWEGEIPDCDVYPVVYRVVKDQTPSVATVFTMTSPERAITYAANGSAELGLTITKVDTTAKDAKYTLRTEGARIVALTATDDAGKPVIWERKNGAYVFQSSATVVLQLANVNASERVTVFGSSGAKTDRFDVNPSPIPPKAP